MSPILEHITFFTPYAPVIQLIAGVYLIFFYQTVFDKDFLEGSIQKKLITNLNQVLGTGGEYITEETFTSDIKKFDTWWKRYTNSVKAVSRMGGVYGITLLIYCGIEGYEEKIGLQALFIDSIIYAAYALIVVFVARKTFLCDSKVWVCGCIVYAVIGFKFPPQNPDVYVDGLWGLTLTEVIHIILWISASGIILSICRYQLDEWHYDHTNKCFNRTTKIQKEFSNIRMTITSNSMEEAMSTFYVQYGDLLEIKNWEYDKINEHIDRMDWGLIFERYYKERYNYWVSPTHKKIVYQILNSPRKIRYCRVHYPCHFAMVVPIVCFIILFLFLFLY